MNTSADWVGIRLLDFGSGGACALMHEPRKQWVYVEKAFDEIWGAAPIAAFFCVSDSVVVVVVVGVFGDGVGSSAV